jgi:hypothetical protein
MEADSTSDAPNGVDFMVENQLLQLNPQDIFIPARILA